MQCAPADPHRCTRGGCDIPIGHRATGCVNPSRAIRSASIPSSATSPKWAVRRRFAEHVLRGATAADRSVSRWSPPTQLFGFYVLPASSCTIRNARLNPRRQPGAMTDRPSVPAGPQRSARRWSISPRRSHAGPVPSPAYRGQRRNRQQPANPASVTLATFACYMTASPPGRWPAGPSAP